MKEFQATVKSPFWCMLVIFAKKNSLLREKKKSFVCSFHLFLKNNQSKSSGIKKKAKLQKEKKLIVLSSLGSFRLLSLKIEHVIKVRQQLQQKSFQKLLLLHSISVSCQFYMMNTVAFLHAHTQFSIKVLH